MKKSIFEVDVAGFRELQEGKPKWMIVRELLANALDEEITNCLIKFSYGGRKATITVSDDSPEGFLDLADVFTLFKTTRKRSNPKVRGRFNLGEKQVICVADHFRVLSTKGGVEIDVLKGTRTMLRKKREAGSEVMVEVKMTRDEYKECIEYCKEILQPNGIDFMILVDAPYEDESCDITSKPFHKTFTAKLKTELKDEESGVMKTLSRETEVQIFKPEQTGDKTYIFELGIPICEIECDYSLNVMQKVPLSHDRDKVDVKYLKTLYGEVLNEVHEEIRTDQSSNLWVRDGFASDRASKESRQTVMTKRFGEKALIANPMDKRSMDEAISNNFNVVYGSEMSKEEWAKVREDDLLEATSQRFKTEVAEGKMVNPTDQQMKVAEFAKKVARDILQLTITTKFYESPDADVKADFNAEKSVLRFNVSHFADDSWEQVVGGNGKSHIQQPMLDLLIHELGHSAGWHYEHSYHDCLTKLGSKLALAVAHDPNYLKL